MSLMEKVGLVFRCVLTLFIMGGLTLGLLWGLTELLWNTKLSVAAAEMIMIGVRVVVGLAGGVLVGIGNKEKGKKSVAGGIILGVLYFLVLLVLKLSDWSDSMADAEEVLTLFIICVCPTVIGSLLCKKSSFHMRKAVL